MKPSIMNRWVGRLGVAAALVGVLALGGPAASTNTSSGARWCVAVEAGSLPVVSGPIGTTACVPAP